MHTGGVNMIDKKVTVKFWQLHPSPNGGAAFGDELRSALKVDLAGRVRELEGSLYQLDGESAQTGNVLLGEALRLQGEALPSLVTVGTKAKPLILKAKQYLGHHTGFIFDEKTGLLGIEVRPTAAGLQKVLQLVAAISSQEPCIPLPVLTTRALERLSGTKNGAFTMKVADPAALTTIDPELGSLREDLMHLKEMVDGTYITVTVGVGPRPSGLKVGKVKKSLDGSWANGPLNAAK